MRFISNRRAPRAHRCWITAALCLTWTTLHAHTQPNILMLVAEDLSPRIGSYGDRLAQTPNLDRLARSSIRYSNAFTTAGVCAPSRAALITGQHQISFGAQHMRSSTGPLGEYYAQPPAELRAFPQLLRAAGYFTYTDSKLDYQFSGVRAGSGPFTIWDREDAEASAWRERDPGQPFFALINLQQTHESGVMRPTGTPHSETHALTQRWRARRGLVAASVTDAAAVALPPYYPDLPAVRTDLARHYDNIHAMDRRVGDILQALMDDGLAQHTVIIWTTDHGDGLPRAKRELYDAGIHVPLLVSLPRDQQDPWRTPTPGSTDSRLVSFVDLAPTILELAGVAPPAYLHGRSLFAAPRAYVFASRDRIDEVRDRQRAVRDTRYKYIRSWHPDTPGGHPLAYRDNLDMVRSMRAAYQRGELNATQGRWFQAPGAEQLYDLQHDPYETRNLAADVSTRETLQRLRGALDAFLERVGDTSTLPEAQLRARLLHDGRVPHTPAPSVQTEGGRIVLRSEAAISSGYRLLDAPHWRLYTGPVQAQSGRYQFKSVRYGWRESPIVEMTCAPAPTADDPAAIRCRTADAP